MCDLICDVITCCVRSCDMGEKITHVIKSCLNIIKKRKCGNTINFYIKLHLKDCFGMEF